MPDPALSAVQLWTHFILTTIPRGRGDYYSHYIDEQTEACRDYVTLSWGDNFTIGDIWVAKKKKKSWVARKHPSLDRRSFDLAELRGSTVLRGRLATWNKSNLIAYVGRHFLLGSQSLKSLNTWAWLFFCWVGGRVSIILHIHACIAGDLKLHLP